jgi:hypothetical protein
VSEDTTPQPSEEDLKTPILGTGAFAPAEHEQFEPAPVNAPEKIEHPDGSEVSK